MAYADFGLGLGLAYKHDFEAADRFKLAAVELGQREAERKFQRETVLKEQTDRENKSKNVATQEYHDRLKKDVNPEGRWAQSEIDKATLEETTALGDISLDPNWQQSMENQEKVDQANANLRNNPAITSIAQAKSKFALAEDDYEKGLIGLDQYKEEERKFNEFKDKGPNAGVYDYQPAKAKIENKFKEYYGTFKTPEGYEGSVLQTTKDKQFFKENEKELTAMYDNMTPGEQNYYGSPQGYVKRNSSLYLPQEENKSASKGSDGTSHQPTEKEQAVIDATANYNKNFIDKDIPDGKVIVDENVGAFISTVAREGYDMYNDDKFVTIDDVPAGLNPDMTQGAAGTRMESFRTPDGGMWVHKETAKSFRKQGGKPFIEVEFGTFYTGTNEQAKTLDTNGLPVSGDALYNQMKAKGRVVSYDKVNKTYRFRAESSWKATTKKAIEYNDASWGGDTWSIGSDEEIPTVE